MAGFLQYPRSVSKTIIKLHSMMILVSILWTLVSIAAPKDPSSFVVQPGGFADIVDGTYVQGSKSFGGIQPDYKIDFSDPDLVGFIKKIKSTMEASSRIHHLNITDREQEARVRTIELVTAMVQKALPLKQYNSQPYLEILNEHRLNNVDISLGSYLACKAGVCRENALLTHIALKAVGIKNKYVYALIRQGERSEDHAFVVVEDKNGRWIVDPYNSNFHGRNFDDLLADSGKVSPRLAAFAPTTVNVTKIIRVNNFPLYWIPKSAFKNICSNVFM